MRLPLGVVVLAGVVLGAVVALAWTAPPAQAGPAWLPMPTPSGYTVGWADFANPDVGWVTAHTPETDERASTSSIMRTRDGGGHWERVYGPDSDLSLGPMRFLDEKTGWVAAERSYRGADSDIHFDNHVLRTTDGGTTWTRTAVGLDTGMPYLSDIEFVNPTTGWIVGGGRLGGGHIWRTSDGGATWHLYEAEEATDEPSWGGYVMQAVSFPDDLHGWVVANWFSFGRGDGAAIAHTADGGLSWERQYAFRVERPDEDRRWFQDVDFVDAEHGWVVGSSGVLMRTSDGGTTWLELDALADADLMTVDFLDPREGWVAGRDGLVFRTSDGGDTWVREAVGTTFGVGFLDVFDQTHGLALAASDSGEAMLLRYGDGPVFTDIASSPYQAAIEGLYWDDIAEGYQTPAGLEFRPGQPLWRAQFAKMIALAFDLPVTEDLTSPFTDLGEDVPWDLYPDGYVAAAWAAGITTGLTPTTFGPFAEATRAQVVSMIVRAARRLDPGRLVAPPTGYAGTLGAFSSAHGESMAWAEYNGLLADLQGFGAAWDAWQAASRGEVAQIIQSFLASGDDL